MKLLNVGKRTFHTLEEKENGKIAAGSLIPGRTLDIPEGEAKKLLEMYPTEVKMAGMSQSDVQNIIDEEKEELKTQNKALTEENNQLKIHVDYLTKNNQSLLEKHDELSQIDIQGIIANEKEPLNKEIESLKSQIKALTEENNQNKKAQKGK